MRQFIYVMALLAAVGLAACREDMMEGENAGEGVALAFRSGVEGLATEALAEEVGNVHVLVYDEAGNFVRREEFGGLDELRPVTLDLGRYTFAFVTDVPEASLEAGMTLEELTVRAEEAGDGGMCVGGVFAGTDSVTVGEDRTSEAELRRLVGRVDVRLEGVTGGARLERAWLLGSPSAARFMGEAVETDTVAMELPMTETADTGVYAGSAMAFPTVAEEATLRFVMNEGGEERTYDVALRNRVEANKVNTVNARYDGTVEPHGVTLALEYEEEWGETLRDSVTADESLRMDWLTVKLVMEEGASTDLSQVRRGYLFGENADGTGEYLFAEFYLDSLPTMRGDTLVARAEGDFYPGEYVFSPEDGGCELMTDDGMRLYTLGAETRAEVSDIANAIYMGTDAVMLSGETAYGAYPVEAVTVMRNVAEANEAAVPPDAERTLVRINNEITAALARSAVKTAGMLPIKAIVVDTLSGRTARYLSAFRGSLPVYARCYNERVMRELALSFGIFPYFTEKPMSRDEFMNDLPAMLRKRGIQEDDYVLVVGGSFGKGKGASFIEVCKIGEIH